ISVPSGSQIKIQYHPDGSAPVLAVRLQEIFGMLETPAINNGKTKLMIHLLSPAYRPVQVTQDLHSFWKNTYAEVRKELRMRYPKHSWPEDPYTAVAIRGAKRKTRG
ncbi:MAG TPA: ATP-dependent helicase C-terminal domain-containing protein, partial [Bacteroidia bacterium]|nr:ATP-dependent helicase C-terminal domain-containing protein [Bacteroidia bacterium]